MENVNVIENRDPWKMTMQFLKKFKNIFPLRRRKHKTRIIDPIEQNEEELSWWGLLSIPDQSARYLKIGPNLLCIDHFEDGWKISYQTSLQQAPLNASTNTSTTPSTKTALNTSTFASAQSNSQNAFIIQSASNDILIKPATLDRPLLASLEKPLFLPGKTSLTVYVQTPACIRFEIGDPLRIITDLPTKKLRDSWFGKNTLEGELCYGGLTIALRLEDIYRESTGILTPIAIVNNEKETCIIKEIKLPLTHLSIYQEDQHWLTTEEVRITFEHGIATTSVSKNLSERAKDRTKEFVPLTKARIETKQKLKSLFNPFKHEIIEI